MCVTAIAVVICEAKKGVGILRGIRVDKLAP